MVAPGSSATHRGSTSCQSCLLVRARPSSTRSPCPRSRERRSPIVLRDCGVTTFAIVGVATEVGIEPTVRHGADLGFIPIVVTDACGAEDQDAAERALASLRFAGRRVPHRQPNFLPDPASATNRSDRGTLRYRRSQSPSPRRLASGAVRQNPQPAVTALGCNGKQILGEPWGRRTMRNVVRTRTIQGIFLTEA